MALTEMAIGAPSRVCETQSGYLWYICSWTTPDYSGCCRVDPCRQEPIGCPPSARQTAAPAETTTTLTLTVSEGETTLTVTATHHTSHRPTSSSSSSSSTPTPGAGAPTSPTIASTSTAENDNSSSNGVTLSAQELVGVVISCAIVAILAAVCAYMWWRRRRRDEDAKKNQTGRLTMSRGVGDEQIPSGMESFFNPMAQSGPGSVFDRDQGRMGKVDSMLGFGPFGHDPHSSRSTSRARSSLVSPPMLDNSWGLGLPSSPSELDSTAVRGDAAIPAQRSGAASIVSRHAAQEEGEGIPRATLNPTQEEREAGTYANSWTRFQNVQV